MALIEYCEWNHVDMALLYLDYAKAFDCVEWELIDTALKHFGFKLNVRKLIKSIYTECLSCIVHIATATFPNFITSIPSIFYTLSNYDTKTN